jgi:hypothetical protein
MIESPLLQEFVAEAIESVVAEDRRTDLVRKAASCPDLDAFRSVVGRRRSAISSDAGVP